MIDKSKVAAIARDAGIKAALAAAGGDDDEAGEMCTCPKCGHEGPAEEFMSSDEGDDDVDESDEEDT